MADEVLIVACPACGQRMKVPAKAVGKKAACVKCGEKVTIPAAGAAPVAAVKHEPAPARAERAPASAPAAAAPSGDTAVVLRLLSQHGLVNDRQVREAELVQKDVSKNAWEILVDGGHVSIEDFHSLMSKLPGVANLDLSNYNVPGDVIQFVPEDIVKSGLVFPVDKLGKLLTVAMACPADQETINRVQERTGLKIKVMACRLDILRDTIRNYYPPKKLQASYDDAFGKELAKEFGDLIEVNEAAAAIFELEGFAPLVHTVQRLQPMLNGTKAPLREIVDAVSADPTVAMLLLTISNSAAYSLPRRVDSLGMAVSLLGSQGIAAVLKNAGSEDYFDAQSAFDHKALWRRAQFCSRAARALAEVCESQRVVTAQAAGLLHEIGRIALTKSLPNSYAHITKGKVGAELATAEKRAYGFSHTDAAYMLARKWNLPPSLAEPLKHQHQPKEALKMRELVAIVALAVRMTQAHAAGGEFDLGGSEDLLKGLNLAAEKVGEVYRATGAAMT